MERSSDLPDDLGQLIKQTELIGRAFLFGLDFIVNDTSRDPGYIDNHLLSYLAQDFLQSVVALPLLTRQGIHNTCRRELRFVLEASVKICFVQQKQYGSEIGSKLRAFKATFESNNISIQKALDLSLLPESQRESFHQEVGRLYGETSNYVHLTSTQILERIAMVNQGRTSGKESLDDIEALNRLIASSLSCCLVFLLHSVPNYVAGDLFVESDGASLDWFFARSKFMAWLDEHFDYKAERQTRLAEIKAKRWAVVDF